jgi:transposase
MAKVRTTIASSEAADRTAQQRPPHGHQRNPVGVTHWSAMARPARALWELVDGLQSLSALAQGRYLGTHLEGVASDGRPRGHAGLGDPLRRWHDCACPPACRRGKKSDAAAEALGRSQGGLSTKLHVRAEGGGRLITFALTPGHRHELIAVEQLLEQGSVKRMTVGRPRIRPKRVAGDKGYSSPSFRRYLRRRGIRYTIPRRTNQRRSGPFDKDLYRLRNRVERLIGRLKQYRRIATRYEKRAANYAAMVTIAAILQWL